LITWPAWSAWFVSAGSLGVVVKLLTIVSAGSWSIAVVTVEVPVTPWLSVTEAVLTIAVPASISACVTVWMPVSVSLAPTASGRRAAAQDVALRVRHHQPGQRLVAGVGDDNGVIDHLAAWSAWFVSAGSLGVVVNV